MAPKHSKRASTPAVAAAETDANLSAASSTRMKVEETEASDVAQSGTDRQTEAETAESFSPQSSGSDDKIRANSQSRAVKTKRGARAPSGKASSSKRNLGTQETVGKDAVQQHIDSAEDASDAKKHDPSDDTPNQIVTNEIEEVTELEGASGSHNPTTMRRSLSINKELAQLGVTTLGETDEEDSSMPRRSRRAPDASPDLKSEALKEEQRDDDVDHMQNRPALDITTSDEVNTHTETGHYEDEAELAEDGGDVGDEGVTRCVCGSSDENIGLMIQCETCKCWQHCVCMGMQVEEDCPDVYYCEQCRPELHVPLLRSLGLLPKTSKKSGGRHQKYSAKELNEAKEAIFLLAEENARKTQAAEAAASFGPRDRKSSANPRSEPRDKNEQLKSPKRRSTMNSRDSAYGWEPIPPGLLAESEAWDGVETNLHEDRKGGRKRKRGGLDAEEDGSQGSLEASEETLDPTDLNKRRRVSTGTAGGQEEEEEEEEDEEEEEEDAVVKTVDEVGDTNADVSVPAREKSKKKKGVNQNTVRETSVAADSSSSKPRHPNQYTYRNKGKAVVASGSGSKLGSGSTSNPTSHSHSPSPSPSKNRAESSRRGAAKDSGSHAGTPAPGESSVYSRNTNSAPQLGLPEHLAHLSYLLPLANQRTAQNGNSTSRALTGAAATAAAAALAKKQASTSAGTSALASSTYATGLSTPVPFRTVASIESSTKVRFPGRRMTLGEMRKRVRNIGEYVTRSQIEAVEREKRMKSLGITGPVIQEAEEQVAQTTIAPDGLPPQTKGDISSPEGVPVAEATKSDEADHATNVERLPMSMRLMEELTRELINFQKRFGSGPGSIGELNNSLSIVTA